MLEMLRPQRREQLPPLWMLHAADWPWWSASKSQTRQHRDKKHVSLTDCGVHEQPDWLQSMPVRLQGQKHVPVALSQEPSPLQGFAAPPGHWSSFVSERAPRK
jgi:hypothetical protein